MSRHLACYGSSFKAPLGLEQLSHRQAFMIMKPLHFYLLLSFSAAWAQAQTGSINAIQSTARESAGEVITVTKNESNGSLFRYCKPTPPSQPGLEASTTTTGFKCQTLGKGFYSSEQLDDVSAYFKEEAVLQGVRIAALTVLNAVRTAGADSATTDFVSPIAFVNTPDTTSLHQSVAFAMTGSAANSQQTPPTARWYLQPSQDWDLAKIIKSEGRTSIPLAEVAAILNIRFNALTASKPGDSSILPLMMKLN